MATREIRTFGDPVLRQRAREIDEVTDLHRKLIKDMIDTMRVAPGVGLAAPQIGVLERIFVWEVEERHGAVVNPRIIRRSSEAVTEDEGCLSVPGLTYPVERSAEVTVTGLDEHGRPIEIPAADLLARVFQHEIDHLDGTLFIDRLPEDLRKDALRTIREQALGLPPAVRPREEML
ncbi:MAG: peptide deformylase [Actinomycetota bacterium]